MIQILKGFQKEHLAMFAFLSHTIQGWSESGSYFLRRIFPAGNPRDTPKKYIQS